MSGTAYALMLQLYDRLKREQPDLKLEDKIKPLAGEMTSLGLGNTQYNIPPLIVLTLMCICRSVCRWSQNNHR